MVDNPIRASDAFKPLRYGMVGGGPGSFIGSVHRKALAMDGLSAPAAGCFSAEPRSTLETGRSLGIRDDRLYSDWAEMAKAEASRDDGIDLVVIVTPNHLHAPVASAFLESGVHVVCDKPLATGVGEAEALTGISARTGARFCVTYTYSGYPAVKHAKSLIASGELGEVRFVNCEYAQQSFALPLERQGGKRAAWRFDPERAGPAATLGDVGTHIEHTVSYVTGLRLKRVLARMSALVPGRVLDDTDTVMTEYEDGASGLYWACQAAPGEGNGLRLRVYGSKGSISWAQEEPDLLHIRKLGEPERVWRRGRDEAAPSAAPFIRLPSGHPEGFIEAFANVYRAFLSGLRPGAPGALGAKEAEDYPTLADGIRGLRFVEACLASSKAGSAWVSL